MALAITFAAWRGVTVTLHLLALSITSWRLLHRKRTRGLWWDDYWALLALLLDVCYFSSIWLRQNPSQVLDRSKGVTVFWMTAILFPSVVWASRVSIGWSIIRFVPRKTSQGTRRALYGLLVLFGLMWLALMLQKAWVCGHSSEWHNSRQVQCFLGDAVGIITLVTDVIGDGGLFFFTLFVYWQGSLHSGQRLLILSILCSSILSLMAGILYAAFVFQASSFGLYRSLLLSLSANIKATLTLTACNLFVIVIHVYKLRGNNEDMETPHVSAASEATTDTEDLKDIKLPINNV